MNSSEWGTEFDAQSSLTVVYVTSKPYYDTRSHLGAQEALQRAYRVCSARLCKKRHNGVHLGLDPVWRYMYADDLAQLHAQGLQLSSSSDRLCSLHSGVRIGVPYGVPMMGMMTV